MKYKIILVIFCFALVFGCLDAMPKNPGACEFDSNCIGIIHPTGQKMCIGEHWIEMGGDALVEIDNTYECNCIPLEGGEFVGVTTGKICISTDFNAQ